MKTSNSDSNLSAPRTGRVLKALGRDAGMWLYNAVSIVGAPFFLHRKWRLLRFLQLDCEFDRARWTLQFPRELKPQSQRARDKSAPRQESGPRVVFMAFGWGEVATVEPLIKALRAARPAAQLIFTVKHREAIPLASQLADEEVLPLPFDRPLPVARWHARARPDMVIFYERFNMAIFARSLWLQRVPLLLVHARINARRADARRAPDLKFKRWQLRGLRAALLASTDYLPGARQIAPADAQLHVVGSIKFPHNPPQLAPARETDLRDWIEAGRAGAPLLAAGSTRETEEAFVLDAFQTLRDNWAATSDAPAPVLLLAPRELRRTAEVVALLRARGLSFSQRSAGAQKQAVDVLLLDTLGELNVAYKWATAAFVGGTICGNSHNVAEPLIWSIPVAYGPQRGNFEIEQKLCEAAGVGFRVHTPDELAAHWTTLLQSPALRQQLSAKADELLAIQRQAFERILQILIEAVDSVSHPSNPDSTR